jgi:hypothetical protein
MTRSTYRIYALFDGMRGAENIAVSSLEQVQHSGTFVHYLSDFLCFCVDIPTTVSKMLENSSPAEWKPVKRKDIMEHWLRCQVYPGQFSVEYAVVVRQSDGKEVSLFAPQEFVDCEQNPTFDRPVLGWIKVVLVKQQGDLALLQLPRSTLENGQYLTVRSRPAEDPTSAPAGINQPMIPCNREIQVALDAGMLIIEPQPAPRQANPGQYCPFDTHSVDLTLAAEISIPQEGPYAYDLVANGLAQFIGRNSQKVVLDTNQAFPS